jgi:hypothetical protein
MELTSAICRLRMRLGPISIYSLCPKDSRRRVSLDRSSLVAGHDGPDNLFCASKKR